MFYLKLAIVEESRFQVIPEQINKTVRLILATTNINSIRSGWAVRIFNVSEK